jgi:hypothetical protein
MEYWKDAVAEALEAEGVTATDEQITALAGWMQSAAECRGAGDPVPEPASVKVEPTAAPSQKEWWRDRSQLVGSDWVLSGRIHDLIASRHA